ERARRRGGQGLRTGWLDDQRAGAVRRWTRRAAAAGVRATRGTRPDSGDHLAPGAGRTTDHPLSERQPARMTRLFLAVPAPAKLNLFLHIIGRRPDGYHELQSAFVPIDLADLLDFERRDDGAIERTGDVIGDGAVDLAVRAAESLKRASGT